MEDYGFFQSWAAVFCAIVGTIIWRIAGVVLASRIPADGPVMGWVNTMAYAMVSAVLLLILVHPTGVLATTGLDHRLIGLGAGLLAMSISKRLIFSLLCGISAFALAIQGLDGIHALAADTDGIDGTEDNAGGFADGERYGNRYGNRASGERRASACVGHTFDTGRHTPRI